MKRLIAIGSVVLFFSSILVMFSGCKDDDGHIEPRIDNEFRPYVNTFFTEMTDRQITLTKDTSLLDIKFDDSGMLPPGSLGWCLLAEESTVRIDKEGWEQLEDHLKEALVFHELGHCILDRLFHSYGVIRNHNCKSIMTPEITGADCGLDYYSDHWRSYYIDELFGISEDKTYPWMTAFNDYDSLRRVDTLYISQGANFSLGNDHSKMYEFVTSFSEMGDVGIRFADLDIQFIYMPEQGGFGGIEIRLTDTNLVRFPFLNGFNWNPESDMEFTLRVSGNTVYFYFNRSLVHDIRFDQLPNLSFELLSSSSPPEQFVVGILE